MIQHQNHDQAGAEPARGSTTGLDAGDARSGALANSAARPVRRVGILGANATGIDVARGMLAADMPVTLYETARDTLDAATTALRSAYHASASDGRLTAGQRDRRVALLAATVNLHHLKDCDVIVDALRMDPERKETLLRRLNEVARPDAVLLASIAGGEMERVAALARFPANVLGYRLHDGAGGRQVWELVPAKATSRRALAMATRLVANLGMPGGLTLPPAMSLA